MDLDETGRCIRTLQILEGADRVGDRAEGFQFHTDMGIAPAVPTVGRRTLSRPGTTALFLGFGCTALTVTALLAGPGPVLLVTVGAVLALFGAAVAFGRRPGR